MLKQLLRVDEVAEVLAVDKRTIYRLLAAGELAGLNVRGALRVQATEINRYIQQQADHWQRDNGVTGNDRHF